MLRRVATLALAVALAGCAALRGRTAAPSADEPLPVAAADRIADSAFLRDTLLASYVHLEAKRRQWGADPQALFARYRPLVERADSWRRLELAMVGFVSEFHDAHLVWRRRRGPGEGKRRVVRLGLDTRFVGPELTVTDVWPGSDAERASIHPGDRIVGIDGESVEQRLGRLAGLRSWSRSEAARYDFAEEWPATVVPADEPLARRRLTRETAGGGYETVEVTPETAPRRDRDRAPVTLVLEGCAAVLRVRTLALRPDDLARQLDPLADRLHAACGLVVDLRDDAGGLDTAAEAVATRLTDRAVTGAAFQVRLSPLVRQARPAWRDLAPDPARPGWSLALPITARAGDRRFAGPMAVLVDAGCRSSCEILALLLRALGARLVGERTGGSSGAPLPVTLSHTGAQVTVPVWTVLDARGQPVEGIGVAPDEEVPLGREEVLARRDPARERALAWANGAH